MTDYVKITHNTGVIKACGNKKYSFDNRLCSSEVFVTYKAPSSGFSHKGFKLYFEFIDRSTQPNCPTELPTTVRPTPSTQSTRPAVNDLVAMDIQKENICKGNKKTLTVPPEFNLFVIDLFYGVSSDGSCEKAR